MVKQKQNQKFGGAVLVGYHGLTEEQVTEIRDLILDGMAINQVVSVIQKDWKVASDVSRIAVTKKVSAYRNAVIAKGIVKANELLNPVTREQVKKRLYSDIDTMHEFNRLICMQSERLYRKMAEEESGVMVDRVIDKKGTKVSELKFNLREDVTQNIRLLSDMLEKQAKLQIDLGVLKRAAIEVRGSLTVTNQDRDRFTKLVGATGQLATATMNTLNKLGALPQTVENGEPLDETS